MNDDSANPNAANGCYPPYVSDPAKLDQVVDRIAQALLDGRAHFLFGAGMSKDSKVPLGRQLAVKLLEEYFFAVRDGPTSKRLEELAQEYPLEAIATGVEAMPGKGRSDLTAKLRKGLFETLTGPSDSHQLFASLCFWDGPQRVMEIFTTNLDKLLEDVFGGKGKSIGHENETEIEAAQRQGLIPIIHLHGKLDESAKYQITEADVFEETRGGTRNRMLRRFERALEEADAFVFVGYSLSDPDFRSTYMRYREDIRARPPGPEKKDKTTYIVAPADDEHHYRLGTDIWLDRGARWIPLSACDFFKELRRSLEHRVGAKELADLQGKYHIADSKVFSEKVDRVARILCLEEEEALGFMMDARMVAGGAR